MTLSQSLNLSAPHFIQLPSKDVTWHSQYSAALLRGLSSLPLTPQRCRGYGGSRPLTIELLPLLALGGLQLDLTPEVTRHLSVVGERRVDGERSFRGL